MKLKFDQITEKVERYELPSGSWKSPEDGDFEISADAAIKVSRKEKQTVLLEGVLDGYLVKRCDRCGESVSHPLQCRYSYLITNREEVFSEVDEIELSDEEAITLYLEGPEIDVDGILQEQAYLEVPLRTLCREDCRGICIGCGADLNKQSCSCTDQNDSSPFAILKKLKKT